MNIKDIENVTLISEGKEFNLKFEKEVVFSNGGTNKFVPTIKLTKGKLAAAINNSSLKDLQREVDLMSVYFINTN